MPSLSNFVTSCEPGQTNVSNINYDCGGILNGVKCETGRNKQSLDENDLNRFPGSNTVNFVPNFHGSSNGYYGYDMLTFPVTNNIHTTAGSNDESCFMDTNEASDAEEIKSFLDKNSLETRRKRPLAAFCETLPKKPRPDCDYNDVHQEGPPQLHDTRNFGRYHELRNSAQLRRSAKSKCEENTLSRESILDNKPSEIQSTKTGCVGAKQNNLELIEVLLKETHGCDLYNYRVCDL